ncbi:lysine--tRNA ligase [Bacteriovorax sp. Seq25_V]|uniref:lysine--tRNA ligase n=1 Tax=Bacteriovorax sp. Seq25_V TaxID=1201288 RepID=UPI00038A0EC3|nr:lysine--tRNA ligase [Bacteriovorax sp. Seq25_V]EQC44195.1 lysine--tRNA ligase [Bacteriovorax sp. Seq25_V]
MSNNNQTNLIHWADMTADRIIKQIGDKDEYVVASGITPSGTVHFGNFREVITTDLVARGLRARGKKVRFIFSWDDYDTFRKVPANLPKQDELKKYMFQPIVDTPDPYEEHESYAAHHEHSFESQLAKVGVQVEPIYQAKKYRAGDYKAQIKHALNSRDKIRDILNQYRSTPYGDEYYPISVYCEKNKTDETTILSWDGEKMIKYRHNPTGYEGEIDLETTSLVKLPWRVDWPMRWAFEKVDFEPGGKDHSSQGGSYTTAKEIVKIFDWKTPVYLQYDFVSIKGLGGKMSSSKGNLVTVNDVLKVYEPEMIRWIFASYKTNVDFAVSFDLDVLKTYEDYDRQERLAFGVEEGNEKKVAMAKRVLELSQIGEMPATCPIQPSFRHLCNVLQINDGDISKAREAYASEIKNDRDERRFKERSECALYWLENNAPEDFKFAINKEKPSIEISDDAKNYIAKLNDYLSANWDSIDSDTALHEKMYEIMHSLELNPADVFSPIYQLLISREKGPKLAGFIRTIGKERVLNLLS